jgi:glucosylceramidase
MLLHELALTNPDANFFRELRESIAKDNPTEDQVVVYETNHYKGVAFLRTVRRLEPEADPVPSPPECSTFVYADGSPLSHVVGFGTALTDSAVLQLNQMTPEQVAALFEFHFGLCRMQFIRIPMGSCDFSLRQYSFIDDAVWPPLHDQTFPEILAWLQKHELVQEEDRQRESWLAQIVHTYPYISVLLAPWSAPPKFKTSGQYVGGELKPECYALWASALVRYAARYQQVLGLKVRALSVQNEPRKLPWLFAQRWETMFYSKEQLATFTSAVAKVAQEPEFASLKLKLLIGDDQRNQLESYLVPAIKSVPGPKIWAIGVHSYQWPGKGLAQGTHVRLGLPAPVVVSEFCTGFHWSLSWPSGRELRGTRHAAQYMRELVASMANGEITGYVDWNLVLDKQGGPNPYKNFVDSLSWYDTATKQLNLSYMGCMFAHVSAFSGDTICRSETKGLSAPLVVSFCDAKRIFLTVFNDGWFGTQKFCVVNRGRFFFDTLDHRCAKTYVFSK